MRLPSGKKVEAGLVLKDTQVKQKIFSLMAQEFSGYIALIVEGFVGMEEGTLIFKKGKCIAVVYEYLKFDLIVMGDLALKHFFNAAGASHGVVDIFSLSLLQVDMCLAFDGKIKLSSELDKRALDKYPIKGFDKELSKKTLEEAVQLGEQKSRKEVFKSAGLEEFAQ